MEISSSQIETIIDRYRNRKGALIPLLQEVQSCFGYVPRQAVEQISRELDVYPVEIYGIITFYAQFYLEPRGKHVIKICEGTACYIMGGKDILKHVCEKLKISAGQTTEDGEFTLETVACLGCCGMAPVVVVDDKFYGNCTIQMIDEAMDELKKD